MKRPPAQQPRREPGEPPVQAALKDLAKFTDENPNPVLRLCRQGRVLYANAAARPLLRAWGGQVGRPLPADWGLAVGRVLDSGQSREMEAVVGARQYAFLLMPVEGSDYAYLYGHDITARREAEDRLAASEASYHAIFDAVDDAIFVHDIDSGAILDINARVTEIYGYTAQEARRLPVGELSAGRPPFTQAEAQARIQAAVAGRPQRFEWLARAKGGREFWAEVCLRRATLGGQERLLAMVRDITARKEQEHQLQLAASVFENSIEGITVTDADGTIQMVNQAFTDITGYTAAEAVGRNPRILKSEHHPPEFYAEMWRAISTQGAWAGEIWNRRKNGEAYPEWLTIAAIKDDVGRPTHYVAVFHDITAIKETERRIRHEAYHDALTGLPNRQLFYDRLEVALARARRHQEAGAVIFADLDRFKDINDSLGHALGDKLLKEVARRLEACVRDEDTVSRLGGDEFLLVLPDIKGAAEAVRVARRIAKAMEQPFVIKGKELFVTISLGLTVYPDDGLDSETLVKNADMAMYRAKDSGRNAFRLYTPKLNQQVQERLSLEQDLRRALEANQFEVHYQPKVDLVTGRVAGSEALVRWRRPGQGLAPPDTFIPLAEETGLIAPLGAWVLEQACRQTLAWRQDGHERLTVAVNLSPKQFELRDVGQEVAEVLRRSGLPAPALELEITERLLVTNLGRARAQLLRLHHMGCGISLDDFGTGYSSLSLLRQLPLSVLKIDKSFVDDLPGDVASRAIAEAIRGLAASFKLKVVAEGVEDTRQLSYLVDLGCDLLQGYLFSPPLTADDFTDLLASGRGL